MRLVPLLGSCLGVGLVFAACNAFTGIGDLRTGVSDAGESTNVDDAGGGGGGDGGLPEGDDPDGGTTSDGGQLPPSGVSPSLAACGEDRICMPNTGTWSPAVQPAVFGTGCSPAWPTTQSFKTPGGGGCGCNCSGGGTCPTEFTLNGGEGCNTPLGTEDADPGECEPLQPTRLPLAVTVTPNPGQPPCTGSPRPQLESPRDAKICTGAEGTPHEACKADEVCVPKTAFISGGSNCILREGESACPARMPMRTLLAESVADGRSCSGSCTCTSTGCTNGTVRFYAATACGSLIRSVSTDGTCTPPSGSAADASVAFQYTPGSPCRVDTPPDVVGGQSVVGARTLCCSFGFP